MPAMADGQDLLARYFDGRMSLPELEAAITNAAGDPVQTESLRRALDAAFANGRLPTQLHQSLKAKLVSAPESSDDGPPTDSTLVEESSTEVPSAETTEIPAPEGVDEASGEPTKIVDVAPARAEQDAVDPTMIETTEVTDAAFPYEIESTEVIEPPDSQDSGASRADTATADSMQSRQTGSKWARPDLWSDTREGPVAPGSVIKNRFVVEEQLGKGGMGTVFKALDKRREEARDADPYVAIKILNDEFKHHPQALVALQREATKAQTLAHPNIITVYDFDRDGGTVYMTMELMRGRSLSDFIRSRRTGVPRDEAEPIMLAMAEGLAYAHKRGIVHSDFKPGNVFLTEDDRIKVLDFGIARATQFGGASAKHDEFDAGELGALTPGYASLEMIAGEPPDPADDVYALAVTAYQLLTGRHPYDRLTAKEALEAGKKPVPIRGLRRREWRTIGRGLELRRPDRVSDAAQFIRRFKGPTKFVKAATAAIVVLALSASFFAYDSMQARGPDVPFEQLSAEVQGQFNRNIELGDGYLEILPNEAIDHYIDAYELHPRNPVAEARIDKAVSLYIDSFDWTQNTALDKRQAVPFVDRWLDNEHMAKNRRLAAFRERLIEEGAGR